MKMKKVLVSAAALTGAMVGTQAIANADTIVTVKAGDTVSELARQYDTTISAIQQLNNLSNPNLIFVGQQLKVQGQAQQAPKQTVPVQPAKAVQTQAPKQNVQPQQTQTVQAQAPKQNVQTQQTTVKAQTSKQQAQPSNNNAGLSSSDEAAKAWIVARESGGNYNARNGQYVGKYQLSASYLNGDYSPANQDRVANQYVQSRYGSWTNAQRFWQAHGWY